MTRWVAREAVARWLTGRPKLAQLDAVLPKAGWSLVFWLRLSHRPESGSNYVFGVSALPMFRLIAITAACIVPSTAMYAWLGARGAGAGTAELLTTLIGVAGIAVTVSGAVATRRLVLATSSADHQA